MKLTLEQPQLANLIHGPTSVVEARNTIPILSHLKVSASQDNKVSVMATDLDIEAVTSLRASVDEPGEFTVPAKPFETIVKRLPKSSTITLEHTNGSVVIKSGRSKFNLQTLPPEDFPCITSGEFTHKSDISSDDLLRILSKVKFAMSTEETRYYLNGVYIHNDDAGDLIAVATDGARIAKMTYAGDVYVAGVIIPRKTIDQLAKVLDGVDGDVALETSETKMRVSGDGFSITSKVVDGTFPDYRRVIPSSCKSTMNVDAKEFASASGTVSAVADAKSKAVNLSISSGVCAISGRGSIGDAVSEVAIEYDGEPMDIGFNSAYTADFMAQADGGVVSLGLSAPMDVALVKFEECDEFVGALMPMRI